MAKLFLGEKLVDANSVSLPIASRGYSFGFGLFETMKFIGGRPCFFGEHISRLKRAVSAAGLVIDIEETVLRERAMHLFESENVSDGVFKIVVSDCGVATQVAMFVKSHGLPEEAAPARLCSSDVRKASQAFTSLHKSLNYMESVLELRKATEAGFDECVFRNERGEVTECAIANLFWISRGIMNTPAVECGLLDGIVRSKVIELAEDQGIPVNVGRFSERDLLEADEAFLTSSGKGPRSVASFASSCGDSKTYSIELLPKLRSDYLEIERREALGCDG